MEIQECPLQIGGGNLVYTAEQKDALQNYINGSDVNYYARKGKLTKDAKGLDELMKSASSVMTVFRGVPIDMDEDYSKAIFNAKVGDTLTDKGFLSTSLSLEAAESHVEEEYQSVIFKINVPKGSKLIDVNDTYSKAFNKKNVYHMEQEVLLHRNTKLKVTKTENKNGTKYIHANLLE